MIYYKAHKNGAHIEKIEIDHITKTTVFYSGSHFAFDCVGAIYRPTFIEAKTALVDYYNRQITDLEKRLKFVQDIRDIAENIIDR